MSKTAKTISHVQGKGSLAHNNRMFQPKNVDPARTPDNITYIREDIATAYNNLFGKAVEEYNRKQKRKDRRIDSYYEHLFSRKPCDKVITNANDQKSFYEDVVQIGTKDDTGVGTDDAEIAKICLNEYINGFQKRNPNFYVFNAVLHIDEATPHLHIDYICIAHFPKGLSVRNGIAKALEEMGYGKGKDAINKWRQSERDVLRDICIAHGIDIVEEQKGRGYSYTVAEYKEHQDKINEYTEKEKELKQHHDTLQSEISPLLESKIISDETVIESKPFVGGYRLVREEDISEMERQKKALTLQIEENKALNAHFDKERSDINEQLREIARKKEEQLKENERLQQKKYELNSKEYDLYVKEQDVRDMYFRQERLNKLLEFNEQEVEKYKVKIKEIDILKDENDRLQQYIDKLDAQKTEQFEQHKKEVKALSDEKESIIAERDDREGKLNDEIGKLKKENTVLHQFIGILQDISFYLCRKIGYNFEKVIELRKKGFGLPQIFNDGGNSRCR